jgi:20S proteasome alpha/beta subunit
MWESKEFPYLPYTNLPYGRITSEYENQGRDDSMSIAIGFVGIDGVLLATDSRMKVGGESGVNYPDDNSQKLWELTDNLGLTSVGSQQGYRQFLLEICQRKLKRSGIKNLSEKAIELLTDTVRDDFMHQLKALGDDLVLAKHLLSTKLAMMVAGYDDNDKPTILNIQTYVTESDIPFSKDIRRLYCIHSASGVAEDLLVKAKMVNELREGLSLNILKRLAVLLIEETKISNVYVGGKIQMATVTRETGFQFVDAGVVQNITEDANIFITNTIEDIIKWVKR